jgi:hypothetical protein
VKPHKAYWTCQAEIDFLGDADRTDPVVGLGERLLAYTGQRLLASDWAIRAR